MKNIKTFNLTINSFAKLFSAKANDFPILAKQASRKLNFRYQIVEGKRYEEAILRILKTLSSGALKISGPHRQSDWEKGWKENLKGFNQSNNDLNQLIPKFVKKDAFIRFQGNFIDPEDGLFETNFVTVMRYYLFDKYCKNANTLYEFGAGTGLNLVAASKLFPRMKLFGLDWANSSVNIIRALRSTLNINIFGKRFDLFNPDKKFHLEKNSAVLTIGTIEQLGKNFKPFINYLLKNSPKVCIHVETIYELYDQNNLLDYLGIRYLEQRNYLKGFLPYLKNLEAKKKIRILDIRKTFGTFYHDGYTYIIWKPI